MMEIVMTREEVFKLLSKRRDAQNKKWGRADGDWPSSDPVKLTVLVEEVGEIANAILEGDLPNLKDELIDTAAVLVAWLETVDGDEYEVYVKNS
jgi:NTP pyrophosphatase (non-canonical NTP hydrolase)